LIPSIPGTIAGILLAALTTVPLLDAHIIVQALLDADTDIERVLTGRLEALSR
jgi:hypothetical protein